MSYSLGSASSGSTQVPKDLGDACQNIWNAAGNNLRVPSEITIDMVGKNPLFTVLGTGLGKISSQVFTLFEGNSFVISLQIYSIQTQLSGRKYKRKCMFIALDYPTFDKLFLFWLSRN